MKKDLIKKTQWIEAETGELCKETTRKVDAMFNDKGYLLKPNAKKVVSFCSFDMPIELNMTERGRVLELSRHLNNDSNVLAKKVDKVLVPLKQEEIISILDLSTKRGREFILKLTKLGIIAEVTTSPKGCGVSYFCINPLYFFAGKRLTVQLYFAFKESLDKELPEWVREQFAHIK